MTYSPFIEQEKTQFGEQTVAQQSPQINLKSIYGISDLRDFTTTTGSATITQATGEYKLTTTASGTDSAILESAERGRYQAGQDALFGIGVRLPSTPTGNQIIRWGYYDNNNGFGFGQDATGIFIFDRTGGTETKVYQSNWNADILDGTGKSGFTLTPSDSYIYQINFSWYGYGPIIFSVLMYDSNNKQITVNVHRLRKTGTTSIENPNLPIRAEIDNASTASAFDSLYVGGRQFSTQGIYNPSRRVTSARKLSLNPVGTTFLPLVTLKRKSGKENISVKPIGIDIVTDAAVVVELRKNASLTGTSYGTPTNTSADETALEADSSATAASNGELIWSGLVNASGIGAGASGSSTIPLSDIDFINTLPMTILVRRITGSNATVSCVFRVSEEW